MPLFRAPLLSYATAHTIAMLLAARSQLTWHSAPHICPAAASLTPAGGALRPPPCHSSPSRRPRPSLSVTVVPTARSQTVQLPETFLGDPRGRMFEKSLWVFST